MTQATVDGTAGEIDRLRAALAASEAEAQRLQRELALFRSVAETVPIGIVLTDAAGKIIYGNSVLERMVRHAIHPSADADSYGEWEAYHPDGRRVRSHEYPLARVLREGKARSELEVHYARGDGSRFWMRIIGEPVRDAAGAITGAIVATIDIDAEVRMRTEQAAMIAELNHRVRNAFRVSQSLVDRVVRLHGGGVDLAERIDSRLKFYAEAHTRLERSDWSRLPIGDMARDALAGVDPARLSLSGPDLVVPARTALALALCFHELARNAAEHGALTREGGTVALDWGKDGEGRDGERWIIRWREGGGPPPPEPRTPGFGTFITQRALALETRGTVRIDYAPTGLEWSLTMPPPFAPGTAS